MLLKIESIEEVGRFASLKHKAPQFGRLTLIYARNGYGKSTLCSVMRASIEGNVELLASHQRLGAASDPKIHMKWQVGSVQFGDGIWKGCPGKVYVFDQDYVNRNVYAPEGVTRDHKRGLLRVVLGEKGVQLASDVTRLDNQQKNARAALLAAEKIIRTAHSVIGEDVSQFCTIPTPADINSKIAAAEKRVELARQAVSVVQAARPNVPQLPALEGITSILMRTTEAVAQEAAAQVKAHVEAYGVSEKWLRYGTEHTRGDECPYCSQNIQTSRVTEVFQVYFSEGYTSLVQSAAAVRDELRAICGPEGNLLLQSLQLCRQAVLYWGSVCDLTDLQLLTDEEETIIIRSARKALELLEAKCAEPMITPQADVAAVLSDGFKILERYATQVNACASLIMAAKADATAINLPVAQNVLDKWIAMKAKLTPPLSNTISDWLRAKSDYDSAGKEKSKAQAALRAYADGITGERLRCLNELLELFGANFTLSEIRANFVGREANADVSFIINGHALEAGEHCDGTPSFKTVLSASDKFTLALALFVVQVRADPELKDVTLVFDDPFTSQDMHRQYQTAVELSLLSSVACQVIVLSHDPRFLQMIYRYPDHHESCTEFQLNCDDKGIGAIEIWSSEVELADLYIEQCRRIRHYATTGKEPKNATVESIVKDIRPFLESHLKARFPGRFQDDAMLAGMTDTIEACGYSDPYFEHVPALRQLHLATRGDHHGGAQLPDRDQLRIHCKRVMKIIGAY